MRIPDLSRATAADMDLDLIEAKLWNIRRFQGHPEALNVRPHTYLVRALAVRGGASGPAIQWSFHHDDHEALIGDFHGLVLNRIAKETDYVSALTTHLDRCICEARQIDWPSRGTRQEVHFYDKLAESIETRFGLGWPHPLAQHPAWPAWLTDDLAERLFESHRTLERPST